jgi:hypothetical protein
VIVAGPSEDAIPDRELLYPLGLFHCWSPPVTVTVTLDSTSGSRDCYWTINMTNKLQIHHSLLSTTQQFPTTTPVTTSTPNISTYQLQVQLPPTQPSASIYHHHGHVSPVDILAQRVRPIAKPPSCLLFGSIPFLPADGLPTLRSLCEHVGLDESPGEQHTRRAWHFIRWQRHV